jgi:hypothetical protein
LTGRERPEAPRRSTSRTGSIDRCGAVATCDDSRVNVTDGLVASFLSCDDQRRSVHRNGGYQVGDDAGRAWRRAHVTSNFMPMCHARPGVRLCGVCSWRLRGNAPAQKVRFLFL